VPRRSQRGRSGSTPTSSPSKARGLALLAPSLAALAVFAVALGALFQFSVVEFIPGSLKTGGFTEANFRAVLGPPYLRYIWDTVVLSALTTALTLLASYPIAYALARTRSARVRSLILVLTLAPFFTGAEAVDGFRRVLLGIVAADDDRRRFGPPFAARTRR